MTMPQPMPTTRFGRSGLVVSRLALGTMTFGLQTDETTSHAILDAAAAGGINFIDTADVYPLGGTLRPAGRTEEIIGRWLKAGGAARSRSIVLATKAVGKMGPHPGTRARRASTCWTPSTPRWRGCRSTMSTCTSCTTTTATRRWTRAWRRWTPS
jgi:aryl-alcohol dehydrogenase-like predicted oxidoreductase